MGGACSGCVAGCETIGATVVPIVRGIHRDFCSDQIIVDAEHIYLIDFDLYCWGDVGVDIGNFNIRVYRMLSLARHISLSTEMTERQHLTERLIAVCETELCRLR